MRHLIEKAIAEPEHCTTEYRSSPPRLPAMRLAKPLAAILFCTALPAAALLLFGKRELDVAADAPPQAFVEAAMRYAAIPGMAIVTVRGGKVDRLHTYGEADVDKHIAVTPDTLFNIASISKPLLGILLLQAERDGLLSLDADINGYLPFRVDNPKAPGVITLRHIATHTSGIGDFFSFDLYCPGKDCKQPIEQYLARLLSKEGAAYEGGRHFRAHAPGTHWEYSNLATALAGFILERRSGKTLDQLSQPVVFSQLLGSTASWKLNGLPPPLLAVQYEVQGCLPGRLLCFDPQSPSGVAAKLARWLPTRFESTALRAHPPFGNPQYPDGGVRTSITGLGNLIVNMVNNRGQDGRPLLDPALRAAMLKVQVPPAVHPGQRLFWRQNDGDMIGPEYIGHIGADYGLFTALYFNPATGDGIAVLMNRDIDDMSWQAMNAITRRFKDGRL